MDFTSHDNRDHNNRDKAALLSELAADGSVPVAPSLDVAEGNISGPRQVPLVGRRILLLSLVAVLLGALAAFIAQGLGALIGLVTNLVFYGQVNTALKSPADHHLGAFVIFVPVIGGLIVGLMARFGSQAIRGHGIPEAMEQVLLHQSRIPARITFLKPLSAAIAIGTGGPFGAEGPIIATGGALGSLLGQLLRTTAIERKALLASGAAAGMAATFNSPVAAVILATELLLFEFRPRTLIPVALASVTAVGVRHLTVGGGPVFPLPHVVEPSVAALAAYVAIGAVTGVAAVWITRLLYVIEDLFEHLPFHWMWWPALGGLAVGVVGFFAPRTLGVGYDNIENLVSGSLPVKFVAILCFAKLVSWSISLGSGTSGGTLAPLFTIGGGLGTVLGAALIALLPGIGLDIRLAALVGMASIFAGASRALLTSVVFAFETTLQPLGLPPLLGGCTAAYLISCLMMENTIMTEKIVRRGTRVPGEYSADFLEQVTVSQIALKPVVTLSAEQRLEDVRAWLAQDSDAAHHQGYPVLDEEEKLIGVVTRRNLLAPHLTEECVIQHLIERPAAVAFAHNSLREVADHMVRERVGRLPIVEAEAPHRVIGIITRSDLLSAHERRLEENHDKKRSIHFGAARMAQ